ncbi:hypothetical protein [Corynebacterium gerontici]|uniref:DivIVA domain-containing protein n=1 Tax=Corynebacterium gerontici TaxID=2079234 RepID=A0A3G6IZE1_9CORY|nr:hypothetical protein [Corynebacterium gerontici]AZA11159.1 hypothetical protein CGERO_04210 [Corynebacterium gerontici]
MFAVLPWLVGAVALVLVGMLLGWLLMPLNKQDPHAARHDAVAQRNAMLLERGEWEQIRFTRVAHGYDPVQVDAVLMELLARLRNDEQSGEVTLERAARLQRAASESPSSKKER